jgi:putative redox protein
MEVTVDYFGATQFEVKARTHTIACDQPLENGGFDEGMTPPELLLASIGTCAGYYAAEYLKARRLPAVGMRIQVFAEKAKAPTRLASFKIQVYLPAAVDGRSREGIIRAMHSCLIHNTLQNPPRVEFDIVAPANGTSIAA